VLLTAGVFATVAANGPAAQNPVRPTADSPIFAGLPADVVAEVLANPAAQENIRIVPLDDDATRDSLWQGMVIGVVQCRELLGAYRTWIATGKAPQAPASLVPVNPEPGMLHASQIEDSFWKREFASGDPRRLRADLLNVTGCGDWIPATPGGPTIAQVLGG
jgi:hypothetical protein